MRIEIIGNLVKTGSWENPQGDDKTLMAVPTKNGCHLVTHPFDLGEFHKRYPNIDVHKNNPTLVYV